MFFVLLVILITMRKDEKTGYYINEVNGRKYAYIQKSHVWNKEKKQAETSLEYVGKIDDEGNFIPKKKHMVKADITEDSQLSMLDEKRIGMVRVLWRISEDIKLTDTLKESFPKTWRAILAVAYYYVTSGRNAAYLFPSWAEDHESPLLGRELTDPDISLLFSEMVEFGYNRDHEDLPQVNLGLIVDSGSKLPLYYHVHDGSIHDVSTLEHVMREGFAFNMHKLMFVMDKGFYSRQNVSAMYSNRYGFIIAMTLSSGTAKKAIDEVRTAIRHPMNIIMTDNGEAIYAKTIDSHWGSEGCHWPCRFHVYTSENEDIGRRGIRLDIKLRECFQELNAGEWVEAHVPLYAKYFEMNECENGVKKYDYKEEALVKAESHYSGYLVLVTDQMELSAKEALDIYRSKDAVEKAFYDLKNEQDARRLGTHGVAAMDGKLFTLFISAILISEIRRRMAGLKEEWTLSKVRTALDKITFSKVKVEHLKKAKNLRGIVSARQRSYLAKLLDCPEKEAVDKLFSIEIS